MAYYAGRPGTGERTKLMSSTGDVAKIRDTVLCDVVFLNFKEPLQ